MLLSSTNQPLFSTVPGTRPSPCPRARASFLEWTTGSALSSPPAPPPCQFVLPPSSHPPSQAFFSLAENIHIYHFKKFLNLNLLRPSCISFLVCTHTSQINILQPVSRTPLKIHLPILLMASVLSSPITILGLALCVLQPLTLLTMQSVCKGPFIIHC